MSNTQEAIPATSLLHAMGNAIVLNAFIILGLAFTTWLLVYSSHHGEPGIFMGWFLILLLGFRGYKVYLACKWLENPADMTKTVKGALGQR